MPETSEIIELIKETRNLIKYYENARDAIENRISEKEKQVDRFLQEAMPETRSVQDITIGGSKDFFYPVWFRIPSNDQGTSKITFCRHYAWNQDTRPLEPSSPHQAALLLEMEGNAIGWDGDANFLEIKRFHERYNPTVSHVGFVGYCKWEKTGTQGSWPVHQLGQHCPVLSTVYLRGGGLLYRIIKNWKGDIQFSDQHKRVNISIHQTHGTWYVEPIPFAQRIVPKQTVNAFVDPD
jgi:hypothetical protein